jgi:hypothetical protein
VCLANCLSSAAYCSISLEPSGNASAFMASNKPLHPVALIGCEIKLVGQLEHVRGAGVAIQLRRERQSHAASGVKVRDLLIGERLDGSLLHSGVGRLGDRSAANQQQCASENNSGHRRVLLVTGPVAFR